MTIAALQALIDEEIPGIRRLPAPRIKPRPATRPATREDTQVDTEPAVAVSMYKDGESVAAITEATGLTEHQIAGAVSASGAQFITDKAPITPPVGVVPEADQTGTAAGLIAWGMQHSSSRMQRLAEQARTALADLQQAQRKEAVVSAAEERVRRAKQQLVAAEQALRAAKGITATPSLPAAGDRPDKTEATLIRAWARENGHTVGAAGIIPRHLVDAYRTAQEANRAA